MKLECKLSDKLDKQGKGFFDLAGKQIVAPKTFGKQEAFEVQDSIFVRGKIQSGELILIKESPEKSAEGTQAKEPDKEAEKTQPKEPEKKKQ